jgi:hypothetical protein
MKGCVPPRNISQPYTMAMIQIHRFDEHFELQRGADRA